MPRLAGLLPGETAFRTLNGRQQLRFSLRNEPGHDVTRPKPLFDLRDTLPGTYRLTVGRSRQVAVPRCIPQRPALIREDDQPMADPTQLGFQDLLRVAGNQVHDTLGSTAAREIACAVQGERRCAYSALAATPCICAHRRG